VEAESRESDGDRALAGSEQGQLDGTAFGCWDVAFDGGLDVEDATHRFTPRGADKATLPRSKVDSARGALTHGDESVLLVRGAEQRRRQRREVTAHDGDPAVARHQHRKACGRMADDPAREGPGDSPRRVALSLPRAPGRLGVWA